MGNCIRVLREERNLTQWQLADKVGVSQSTVACWESGRMCPLRHRAETLAEVFNVPLAFLLAHRKRLFT